MAVRPGLPTPDQPLFFSHIPKTAGHAVGTALATLTTVERFAHLDERKDLSTSLAGLPERPAVIQGHIPPVARPLLPEATSVVTLLRDPVPRTRSQYRYTRVQPLDPHHELLLDPGFTFDDFLHDERTAMRVTNAQARFLIGVVHQGQGIANALEPADWVRLGDDEVLERALASMRSLELVGTVDRLEEFFAVLSAQIGWPLDPPPVLNATSEEVPLADAQVERILELNRIDTDLVADAHRLLDRAVAEAPPPPVVVSTDAVHVIDLADPAPVHGFHSRHHMDGVGWCRWTGPDFRSTVTLPVTGGQRSMVVFRVVAEIDPTTAAGSVIAVDGLPLETQVHPRPTCQLVVAYLPPDATAGGDGTVTVELHTPHLGDWFDDRNQPREVGLAVKRIGIAPDRYEAALLAAIAADR